MTQEKNSINKELLNKVEELKAAGDFLELAKIEAKKGEFIKALSLYKNNGTTSIPFDGTWVLDNETGVVTFFEIFSIFS